MSQMTTSTPPASRLTTPEQRDRFANQATGRVTIVAALRLAGTALANAGNHATPGSLDQRALRFVSRLLTRWASRRSDRLQEEFFPQAVLLGVTEPPVGHVGHGLAPYGTAWVTFTVDGDDDSEIVYETYPTEQARAALYAAVQEHGATTDPDRDDLAAQRVARHVPTVVPQIVQWLAEAQRAGRRQEAEEEAEREQEHRDYVAARTCSRCGERGRWVEESDIPHDEYDVRTASEWLETHDGLTFCDNCGHRWWV